MMRLALLAIPAALCTNETDTYLVAWRQNLTERWGDLDAATRTARRTILNSSFWAQQIRSMA